MAVGWQWQLQSRLTGSGRNKKSRKKGGLFKGRYGSSQEGFEILRDGLSRAGSGRVRRILGYLTKPDPIRPGLTTRFDPTRGQP